jgi:hypothetical protein
LNSIPKGGCIDRQKGAAGKDQGYWDRELGRLIYPVPEMGMVIDELKEDLRRIV